MASGELKHERAAVRGIRRACSAALDSTALRQEIAAHAVKAVPAEAYFFNSLDPQTGLLTHVIGTGGPPALKRTFLTTMYPNGEAERIIALARSGRVVSTNSSDEFRSLINGNGFDHELRVAFAIADEPWGLLCALREHGARAYSDQEASFFQRIAPLVARALRTAALLAAAGHADGSRAPSTDDATALPGVIVVDRRGRVVQRTASARAQIVDIADHASPAADLPSSILGLLARQRLLATTDVPSLRVHGRSGRWYSIHVAVTEPDASDECKIVVIIEPLSRADVAPLLAHLYGLSPREREVVAMTALGNPTKSIAARLGISRYTVQDHLDRASEKVGVRGRRGLLAKLYFDGFGKSHKA